MLFLRSWLEEYISLSGITDTQLEQLITTKSSEVDGVETYTDYFNHKVVVGKITNIKKHPKADTLNIFDVIISPDGEKKVQIVSAAENVREGLYVPVALIGAKLPAFSIAERKLRGETSYGMCCGKSELGLETQYSKGLWELENDKDSNILEASLGESICTVFNDVYPQDTVFDIKVLPDKISALGSHLGIAKELSIILPDGEDRLSENAKNYLNPEFIESEYNSIVDQMPKNTQKSIEIDDTLGYVRRFDLYDIRLQSEYILPHKYQLRMHLLGQNLVGGFADLTNYMLLDIGQPTHSFGPGII